MTKSIKKISDKLVKVNESFSVYMYDNGYMVEVSGRNKEEDWATIKLLVADLNELSTLIKEITEMERD